MSTCQVSSAGLQGLRHLHAHCACCYFTYAKTTNLLAFNQSVYVTVVFMNARKLHFTLNMFLSFLFVNNSSIWSIHKYFIHIVTLKAKSILSGHGQKCRMQCWHLACVRHKSIWRTDISLVLLNFKLNLVKIMYHGNCGVPILEEQGIKKIQICLQRKI